MRIEDVITREVIVGRPDMSLNAIGRIFKEKRISGIPIVDQEGQLVGIVTLTDMLKILDEIYEWRKLKDKVPGLKLAEEFEQKKENATAKDIMTRQVETLPEDCSMDDVMTKMFDKRIHTIPIVKDDKIVGIIGKHDLISACFE